MKYVISIDLGATNLRVGIIDENLNIIQVLREPTIKEDKIKLLMQIERMIDSLPWQKYNITTIGVSACGFIEHNYIKLLPNLKIHDFDLQNALLNKYQVKVNIRNDANATALSESIFGASKNYKDSYFITVSSGIGGCLVTNHQLVDLPFEIGHSLLLVNNSFKEFEKVCSGNGIVEECRKNDINVKHAGEFFELVKQNNPLVQEIYNNWIKYMSMVFANIQLQYNTDCIVLSGGVMKSEKIFLDDIKEFSNKLISHYPCKPINFVNAKFDQDAGLMGGATVALV